MEPQDRVPWRRKTAPYHWLRNFYTENSRNTLGVVRYLFLMCVIVSLGASIASIPSPGSIFRQKDETKGNVWKFEALLGVDVVSFVILVAFLCCIPVGNENAGFKLKLFDTLTTILVCAALIFFGMMLLISTEGWETLFCGSRPASEEGNKGQRLYCSGSDLTPWESCICDVKGKTTPAMIAGSFAAVGGVVGLLCLIYIWKSRK